MRTLNKKRTNDALTMVNLEVGLEEQDPEQGYQRVQIYVQC